MEDQDIVRVHVIVPEGFDNPGQPTGGNIYDRRVCAGLPEAFGSTADGFGPGQLIPPGDPAALAAALGDWLGDEGHRHRLRAAGRQRQPTLRGWEQTTQEIADALTA
jgi:glycosyltransferase involved in cell wall biosynthesis